MLSTCPRQMMFAWGQVNQQKNCCSVKELCIHSRETLDRLKIKNKLEHGKRL